MEYYFCAYHIFQILLCVVTVICFFQQQETCFKIQRFFEDTKKFIKTFDKCREQVANFLSWTCKCVWPPPLPTPEKSSLLLNNLIAMSQVSELKKNLFLSSSVYKTSSRTCAVCVISSLTHEVCWLCLCTHIDNSLSFLSCI